MWGDVGGGGGAFVIKILLLCLAVSFWGFLVRGVSAMCVAGISPIQRTPMLLEIRPHTLLGPQALTLNPKP